MIIENIPRFLVELIPNNLIDELSLKIPHNQRPIWQYWLEFVEKYLRTGKSEITVKGVKDGLKFAIRRLNILSIEDLNDPRIIEEALFTYKEANHIKNSTFNSYRKNFNTYCIWLEKMQYIKENLISKVEKCKQEQNEQLTLNEEQVRKVIVQIHDRRQTRLERFRNTFFIDLLRFTGARPCELLNARIKDVRRENDGYKIVIHGKKQKGRNRYYKFSSFVRDSYEAYMAFRRDKRPNEEKLFVSCSKKTGWTHDGMKRLFARISKELGFTVTAYSFRRYVATKLHKEGISLEKIANYLGHTRITTTQRYIERSCALTEDCSTIMAK